MAEAKKSAAVSKTVKTEPETVKAEAKETVKAEAKAAKKETKTTAKKAPAKKAAAGKTAEKAEPKAEKAEPKAKTAKQEVKKELHLQFSGKSYSTEDFQKIADDVWKYDLHKEEGYQSLELYVKPEESIVYYVFNGDITGSFFI